MPTLYKNILKRFGIFLVVFTALSFLFFTTPAKKFINETFRSTHLGLYQKMLPDVRIKFNPRSGNELDWGSFNLEFNSFETERKMIAEARRKQLKSIDIPMESMTFHLELIYTPFLVFLFSLLLVTPLPIKEKLIAFAGSFLLLFILQFFRILIKILWTVNSFKIGAYEFEGATERLLQTVSYATHAGFATFMTVVIWGVVVFNKENTRFIKKEFGI